MVWKLSIYNQIKYKDMKGVINGKMVGEGSWLAKRQCGAQIPKVNLCKRSMGLSRFIIFFKRTLMRILRLGFL